PCLQYWPEPGIQQFGPMTVELLSRSADDDVIIRLFRIQNITRLQEGQLVVRHFQFLRWSPYRDVPDSKKAFLSLLAQVHNWQRECGEGRAVVHCLNGGGRSGTFCACTMILEMIQHHSMVDVFFAAKTLRNSKPNMVETMLKDSLKFKKHLFIHASHLHKRTTYSPVPLLKPSMCNALPPSYLTCSSCLLPSPHLKDITGPLLYPL
ncbi:hypothetical protein ATANTOWER_013594, partial [Ataeniobius toweri]|nr:hypothetical protein [Ataeniobius toweri]